MKGILRRSIENKVYEYLKVFPVVSIVGARQVGKSTLAQVIARKRGMSYFTLDDLSVLQGAKSDPKGFIDSLPKPVIIDEIQRVPELLLVIKRYVDEKRRNGEFLLTGSSKYDVIRGFKETLAGRIGILNLYPMNVYELYKRPFENPLEEIFKVRDVKEYLYKKKGAKFELEKEILRGGFPTPALYFREKKKEYWFEEYKKTYMEKDIPAIMHVQDLPTFFSFLNMIASYSGKIVNLSEIARSLQISTDTARRWLNILELTFLIERIYVYRKGIKKRVAKSPKIFLVDSGLLSNILRIGGFQQPEVRGQLFETWLHQQLRSFVEYAKQRIDIFYFRTYTMREVDFVIVSGQRVIAVEVKYSKTLSKRYLTSLKEFVENLKAKEKWGLLVYTGREIIPFSENILAVPVYKLF